MSFQLDGNFDVTPPKSVLPSTAVVDTQGLGESLDRIGQALSAHDAIQDRIADKQAAGIEAEAMASYEPDRATREADYTGEQAGYAQNEIAAYDKATQEYRQMALPPRVQAALTQRLDARRLKVSNDAIAFEAVKRGGLEGERRAAQESASDNAVLQQIAPAADQATRAVYDAWDGKSSGYASGVSKAFDDTVTPMVQDLPEVQRLRLQPRLDAQKNAYFASAMAAEDKGADANNVKTANDAASTAVNMVLGNADAYQTAGFLIDHAAQALPVALQKGFRQETGQKLILARFDNLLDAGQVDQVKSELPQYGDPANGGLEPENYARVQDGIKRAMERKQATDFAGQAAMQSRVQAYLDGVMAGDDRVKARPSDDEIAATMGEKGLFEFRQKEQLYKDAHLQVGDFSSLPMATIDTRISALQDKVKAGGTDYTQNSELLDAALKARDAQVKARAADPAGWAMAADGTQSDPGHPARYFWSAAQNAANPAQRAYSLRTYADATMARQNHAGIPNPQLLPADYAKAQVKAITDAPPEQKAQAFQSLVANVADWGDYRGKVIDELRQAGLGGQEAVIAAEFPRDPMAQQAFMQGAPAVAQMKPKDKSHLDDMVQAQMAKFDATAIGPGMAAGVRQDRYKALSRIAAGYAAQGDDLGHAVQRATADYRDAYSFVSTWRMPAALANAKPDGYDPMKVISGDMYLTNRDAVTRATLAIKNGLAGTNGAAQNLGTTMPGEGMTRLSDNVTEARVIAKQIAATSRWVTTPDDTGLALMVPDPVKGSWAVVRDKGGAPISYSFGDLAKIGNFARGQAYVDERRAGVSPMIVAGDPAGAAAPIIKPSAQKAPVSPVATVEKIAPDKIKAGKAGAGAPSTVFPTKKGF